MARRAITVEGTVQGVGFRPFVCALARRLGLRGFVRNLSGGVGIEVQGEAPALDEFLAALTADPPSLSQVESVRWTPCEPGGEPDFSIASSEIDSHGEVLVPSDVGTCDDCLAEMLDPGDRRFEYPFLNCTACGPRLTIIRSMPYDRQRTTMASFSMCAECRREYEDEGDRRFHAQPIACPACGPRLRLLDADGGEWTVADPLRAAAEGLRRGRIGAIKGLGGYHLACNATNEAAVGELRRRKTRDAKPLAVMVADAAAAATLCELSAAERELLVSRRRPIVLLRRRQGAPVAAAVAPGHACLGLMLPYTPLHHLLLRLVGGTPLVLTSGNRADEPIAFEDDTALRQLAGVADFYLVHDRPIHIRCDDSVARVVAGKELPLRRSRGYAPQPLALPLACAAPMLAVGGQSKATFALGFGRRAIVSHHLGDLDHFEAYRAYVEAVGHYQELFQVCPTFFVHDLHPDYASTAYAIERAAELAGPTGIAGRPCRLAVQHHHAHLASCLAEHGLGGPALGVIFDGTGWGTDGAVWGGEFLVGDYAGFRRAAHLRYVPLPGGDRAIREPWRMAAAHLLDAGESLRLLDGRVPEQPLAIVRRMIARRIHAPLTSSMGRLFDAVAAIAGVRREVSYDGQAAMELQGYAEGRAHDGGYPFELTAAPADRGAWEIDTRPLIGAVAEDARKGYATATIARRFHAGVVEMVSEVCGRLRDETQLATVVLSGGVFANSLLLEETAARLTAEQFQVYRHERVPPNDGGLSFGQLAIGAAWLGR